MEQTSSGRASSRLWVGAFLVATFATAALTKTGIVPGWPGLLLFASSFLLLYPMIRSVERVQFASGIRSEAMARYNRRMIFASLGYVAALLCGVEFVLHENPAAAVRVVIAISVAVPVIFMIRAAALLLKEETDEFLRLLYVRQSLIAMGFLLTVATLYGFLNAFDVAPRVDAWAAVPLWGIGVGIGAIVNRLSLGFSGRC
jgi:hypothetical protein